MTEKDSLPLYIDFFFIFLSTSCHWERHCTHASSPLKCLVLLGGKEILGLI